MIASYLRPEFVVDLGPLFALWFLIIGYLAFGLWRR